MQNSTASDIVCDDLLEFLTCVCVCVGGGLCAGEDRRLQSRRPAIRALAREC